MTTTKIKNDSGVTTLTGHLACYVKFGQGNLSRINGMYVDDIIVSEGRKFERECRQKGRLSIQARRFMTHLFSSGYRYVRLGKTGKQPR